MGVIVLIKWLLRRSFKKNIGRLLETEYDRSLWEGMTGILHHGILEMMENEYRANFPEALRKPIGARQKFPHFDGLLLNPAQLYRRPLYAEEKVDLSCTLGKHCARPLKVSMPIMISAMGYGISLTKSANFALARASGKAGTAYNSGQGPVLKEYRQLAHRLIIQVCGVPWQAKGDDLKQADAIEIKLGRGAQGGVYEQIPPRELHRFDEEVIQDMELTGHDMNEPIIIPSTSQMLDYYGGLENLIERLHNEVPEIPVIIKLPATHDLERDMEIAIAAGANILVIEGAQGGTPRSPSILVNDFGLPTLAALVRAVRFLQQNGYDEQVDLVISGGLRTPGDVMKALALGANAVYLGTAALFALDHAQIAKALPFDPPTSLVYSTGARRDKFNEEEGTTTLLNFLLSFADELKFGLHALGKTSIAALSPDDLVAWDADVARITGLPLV